MLWFQSNVILLFIIYLIDTLNLGFPITVSVSFRSKAALGRAPGEQGEYDGGLCRGGAYSDSSYEEVRGH